MQIALREGIQVECALIQGAATQSAARIENPQGLENQTVGCHYNGTLSRNRYWGESDDKGVRSTLY